MQAAQAQPTDIPICQKGPSHQNLPIIMICLQKGCSRKRLCCLSCIDQLHIKHQLVSLRKYYTYIEQIGNYNLNVKNKAQIIKLLQKTQFSVRENLQKTRQVFNKKIQQLLKKSQNHFEAIKESFNHQKFHNVSNKIKDQFTDEKVQEYYKIIKQAQNNLSRPFEQIQKLVAVVDKNLKDKIALYAKQLDRHSEIISQQILQFKISKNTISKLEFSPTTKSQFIQVVDNGKTVKRIQGAGGYPIAIVNHQFTPDNNTVGFKILEQPGAKGIWMGVCVLDVVKNFNYQSCYGIGKGSWGIDQVGQNHASAYSWSHHDSTYNSAPKVGWQFWIGDLIQITVDYQKSVARFTKNKQLQYEQPIKLDLGPIYAFAGCTHINDTITLA